MTFPRPEVDIRAPPSAFDPIVDWLEAWSYRLVLLEEYPLSDVRAALEVVAKAVREHRASTEGWLAPLRDSDEATARIVRVLLSDHEWFETSLEQFDWFFRVVEREDHGGHRQALGQYGRVFAESLRRHRRDERSLKAQRPPGREGPVS